MNTLTVIKIGGNIIDDDHKLGVFLRAFADVQGAKILVHGGGKLATRLASALGIPQQLIDGRRITDGETLKTVTMVYAGYINKNIVAQLQSHGCDALGLCGADGDAIRAHRRVHPTIDYGYVGDIDQVNTGLLKGLLDSGLTLVIAPITHNGEGQLLNTNADTIAQEIAQSMSAFFEVDLLYSFEKNGVLLDIADEQSVIPSINRELYEKLKAEKKIVAGMIPKIDNAFAALGRGVKKVVIGNAEQLPQLILHSAGTKISHE